MEAEENIALRHVIASSASSVEAAEGLAKDTHLLEACRHGDLIVASNDRVARAGFARCVPSIGWLGRVVWVNPATEPDLVEWLERGAPSDPAKQLESFQLI